MAHSNDDKIPNPMANNEGLDILGTEFVPEEALSGTITQENLESLCKERVCPLCVVQQEAQEIKLRAAAEMENFKKRLGREHEEQMRYASEEILTDLLPTLDNFDLAFRYGSSHEACNDLLQGI